MKKLSTYLASVLLMIVVLSSCSSSPENINVADLEEPCEFVDATEQCLDAIIQIAEGAGSPDQLSEDDKKRIGELSKKGEEIGEEFEKKFGVMLEAECPNLEEVFKKAVMLIDLEISDLL
jgi:hypothetical protein